MAQEQKIMLPPDLNTQQLRHVLNHVYPVGSIYMSMNQADPGTLFGGTWERVQDRFLLASGSTYVAGTTGGSADSVVVSHTHAQKAHSHGFANGDKVWTTASGSTEPGNQISGRTTGPIGAIPINGLVFANARIVCTALPCAFSRL